MVMKIGYDYCILRLEGYPKEVLGSGSEMIGFWWVKKKKKKDKGAATNFSNCGNCFRWLWGADGWLWKGSENAKNVALIPSVRTLVDSKLEDDHYRGSSSLELYRGSLLQVAAQRLQKIFIYS
ncbi:hypothetical protein B296_00016660 [Ensete ventricosum]|uniref:Uncharacterized protein n=1 Tax=Ensete ventricosum TaxID=4639 RepID=A0A426YBG8_ENSVE|nr:hypothetical protein B296_00016660 [Ensete ventricosum]